MADHNSYYDHVSQLVRALTEVDTEAFIRNSSLNSLFQKENNDTITVDKEKDTSITNNIDKKEDCEPDENNEIVNGHSSSGSFFKKLGGILRRMAARILGRK